MNVNSMLLNMGDFPLAQRRSLLSRRDRSASGGLRPERSGAESTSDPAAADRDLVANYYRTAYTHVLGGSGVAGRSYRLTHRALEWGVVSTGSRILEIGAGDGQHLEYVADDFAEYVMLDPFGQPSHWPGSADDCVRWVKGRAEDCDAELGQFDRVIATCVLHHVDDVAEVLRNVRKWLRPGGRFSLFLPSDPGLLNRLNRRLFVTPRARRLGFDQYVLFNAREHRNHYWSIRTELLHQFSDCRVSRRYYPFGIPVAGLSLFSIWQITVPESLAEVTPTQGQTP